MAKVVDRAARVDIISIGTLSRNRLWGETVALRTPHSTCTLVRVGKKTILIDPGLPAQIMAARLAERTGLQANQVDMIFLTNFRPAHRAGIAAFPNATVLIGETEQMTARQQLEALLNDAPEEDLDRAALKIELRMLDDCRVADDKIAQASICFRSPVSRRAHAACSSRPQPAPCSSPAMPFQRVNIS